MKVFLCTVLLILIVLVEASTSSSRPRGRREIINHKKRQGSEKDSGNKFSRAALNLKISLKWGERLSTWANQLPSDKEREITSAGEDYGHDYGQDNNNSFTEFGNKKSRGFLVNLGNKKSRSFLVNLGNKKSRSFTKLGNRKNRFWCKYIALCGYPLKLEGSKILRQKVKASRVFTKSGSKV